MKDKQFGKLQWTDSEVWETTVSIDYFRGFGERVYEDEPQPDGDSSDDPSDSHVLHRKGQYVLTIDTAGQRKPPAAAQRIAWEQLRARGDALWNQLVSSVLAEYQFQRPVRVRWWKAIYGDEPYDHDLPEARDTATIKKLIVPYHIRIQSAAEDSASADIGVQVACSWFSEGCGVIIRDGAVVDVGGSYVVFPNEITKVTEKMHHPTFGELRRIGTEQAWLGIVRLEPFREFYMVAPLRAAFRENPTALGPPTSKLEWSFARGEFIVWVHSKAGQPPTSGQAMAMDAFKANENKGALIISHAIFDQYLQSYDERRRDYRGPHIDSKIPKLQNPDGLRELIELIEVNVFPDVGGGHVTIGLVFVGAGRGFGVQWRDGKVEVVGPSKIGRP